MDGIPYASAIGSIMYAMLCTRPDISYALSITSRFQKDHGEDHWTAVKNILKYLRRTKDLMLVYGGEECLAVTGYCDASFQTDTDDSRSQTGYIYMLATADEWLCASFLDSNKVIVATDLVVDKCEDKFC